MSHIVNLTKSEFLDKLPEFKDICALASGVITIVLKPNQMKQIDPQSTNGGKICLDLSDSD